jgi:hypothetical protein
MLMIKTGEWYIRVRFLVKSKKFSVEKKKTEVMSTKSTFKLEVETMKLSVNPEHKAPLCGHYVDFSWTYKYVDGNCTSCFKNNGTGGVYSVEEDQQCSYPGFKRMK